MSQKSYSTSRRLALLGATALVAGLSSSLAQAQSAAGAPTGGTNPGATAPCSSSDETNCTRAGTTPLASPQGAVPAVPEATEQVEVTGTRIQGNNANSANPITVITAKEIAQSQAQTIEDVLKKLPSIGSNGIGSQLNNGGDGADCTDIRNLGFQETLVLVDGKRFVQTGADGFSCVDLNNIPLQLIDHIDILKDGASTSYGADAVSGVINIVLKKHFSGTTASLEGDLPTRGGGSTGEVTVTSGATYDKGSLVIGVDYLSRAAIPGADRNYAINIAGDLKGVTGGSTSGFVPFGRVLNGDGNFLADANGNLTPFTTADRFNYAPFQDLNSSLEKESISALGNYDLNEYMTAYLETFFTHKYTTQQLAPEPIFLSIPASNPYNKSGSLNYLYQRALEFGPREYQQKVDTLQINAGVRGTLPYGVDYDAYYSFGRSSSNDQLKNSTNTAVLQDAINAGDNPFSPTSATVTAARLTETDTAQFNLRTYGIDLSKKDLATLPYGDLGLAFGFDHREEDGNFQPDSLVSAGLTPEAPTQPTAGGFNVNEVYGEVAVPVLSGLPFAKELDVNLGGRYFDYNTAGTGKVWKVTANYTPIDDIRFRANLGTAFRQPSINEAFGGQSDSFNDAHDPCDAAVQGAGFYTSAQLSTIRANCAHQGVPANFASSAGTQGQIETVVGGNPKLQPEQARTEGLGMILKPRWVPNLAVTVDYFKTKITDTITSLGTQTILDGCYESANLSSSLCNDLTGRNSFNNLNPPIATNQNIGVTKTSGMDFGVTYNIPLGNYGAVSLNNQSELIFNYFVQNSLGGGFTDYNGTISDSENGLAFPRFKDNNSVTWSNGALSVNYTTRFISPMNFEINNNPAADRVTKVAETWYNDIEATYVYHAITLTAGIDNILDEPAPFVPDGNTNTGSQIYDIIGRTVYAKTTFKF